MIRIKTPEQIEGIRRSCKVAAAILSAVGKAVYAGQTTAELDRVAAHHMSCFGAKSATLGYVHENTPPFPGHGCFSVNEQVCHGVPTESRKLQSGDIIKVDITTVVDGYYGDCCETFLVGHVSRRMRDLVNCARECRDIGIAQVKPGGHIGDIGFAIMNYAAAHGYSVVYNFCGHGVGLEFHEEPQVPHLGRKGHGDEMKPGMIFTIEPMINLGKPGVEISKADGWTVSTADRKPSAQFEHTLLVTESGVEVLTQM